MILERKNFPALVYLTLFSLTGLVSNYGALDRIASQWLYLSLINTLGLIYFLYECDIKTTLKKFFRFKPFFLLVAFVLWGFISIFYALNGVEVIVKFIRWAHLPLSLLILTVIYLNYDFDFVKIISLLMCFVLLFELYFSLKPYYQIIQLTEYNFSFADLIKGATGNKNITAASVLIKTPFIFYILDRTKNQLFRFLLSIIIFCSLYLVFLLSARSALIAFFLILFVLIVRIIYSYLKDKNRLKNTSTSITFISILFAIIIFQLNFRNENTASFTKRVSSINTEDTSTQQRLRYYKHSANQILSHPIIGVGLGNWKIKSIDYDKYDVKAYVIPYHTHNDFLEIGAELGLIGLILYILIFYYPFVNVFNSKSSEIFNLEMLILCAGIVYFIDSNLNFPHARPVMLVPFMIILMLSFTQKNKK